MKLLRVLASALSLIFASVPLAYAAGPYTFTPDDLPRSPSGLHLSGMDPSTNVLSTTSGIANSVTTLNPELIGGGVGRGDTFTQTTAAAEPIFTPGQGLVFSGSSALTDIPANPTQNAYDNWELFDASFDCTAGAYNSTAFFSFGGNHSGGNGNMPTLSCVKSVSGLTGPQLDLQYGLPSGTNDVYIPAPAAGKHSVLMYLTPFPARLPCIEVDGGTPSCGSTPVYQQVPNNRAQFGAGQPFTLINFWQGDDYLTQDQINMLTWYGNRDAGLAVASGNPYATTTPTVAATALAVLVDGTPVQNDKFRNQSDDAAYDPINKTCSCAHDESHQGTLLSSTGYLTGATQQFYNNFSHGAATDIVADTSNTQQSGIFAPAYSPDTTTTPGPGNDSSQENPGNCVEDPDSAGVSRLDFIETVRPNYNGYEACYIASLGEQGQGFQLGNGASTVRIFQWATWEVSNGQSNVAVPQQWPANWLRTSPRLTNSYKDSMEFDAPELYSGETTPTAHITPFIHPGVKCQGWLHYICSESRDRSNAIQVTNAPWSNYLSTFFDASGATAPTWCANSAGPIIAAGTSYPAVGCNGHIWTTVFDPSIAEVITYLDGYELTRVQYNKVWLDPIYMLASARQSSDCTGGHTACPGPYHLRYMYWWAAYSNPVSSSAVAP